MLNWDCAFRCGLALRNAMVDMASSIAKCVVKSDKLDVMEL